MKHRHGRHSRDTRTPELGELPALGGVDVDEAVHVADAETLDRGWGVELPLGAETGGGSFR